VHALLNLSLRASNEVNWGTGHNSAFGIIIDYSTEVPSGFAGAVPEFYLIVTVAVEKGSKEVCNGNGFALTRVM